MNPKSKAREFATEAWATMAACRHPPLDRMKSALFVDFDNIFSGLRRLDPAAADHFATQPQAWMRWIAESLEPPPHAPAGARRVLVRRCYLNPQVYQRFRPAFNRAGFEIIDCPAMTSGGKTSTDIHMVLDIVDLLQHQVHYDEFIVLSADADFTPVLRKLRRWDRRTTVLAIGFPSAAYQASADLLIDQDAFVREGLGREEPETPPATPAPPVPPRAAVIQMVTQFITRSVADAAKPVALPWLASKAPAEVAGLDAATWAGLGSFRKVVDSLRLAPLIVDWESGVVFDPARHAPASHAAAAPLPDEKTILAAITQLVRAEVAKTKAPMPCGRLAQVIIDQYGSAASDWCGRGTFRKLLEALPLAPLVIDWTSSGGYVLNPLRQGNTAADWGSDGDLRPLLEQIHTATGMPLLPPPAFQALLAQIAADTIEHPFSLTETGKRVRDRCRDAGLPVNRSTVSFVLKGILLGGHVFGEHANDAHTLGLRFMGSILSLCQTEQLALDDAQTAQLREWATRGAPR